MQRTTHDLVTHDGPWPRGQDMSRWAPDDAAGNHAYVVTIYEPGAPERTEVVVYAASLVAAQAAHGRRGSPQERRSVRRATVQDVRAKAVS